MGDAEKNTEATVEGAMGGALFIDEMHNLYETGYSGGDAYGTAILETLLPTWRTIVPSSLCSVRAIPTQWTAC